MHKLTTASATGHPAVSSCNRIAVYSTGERSVQIPLPAGIVPRFQLHTPLGIYQLVALVDDNGDIQTQRMWDTARADVSAAREERLTRLHRFLVGHVLAVQS
jgi:hypothetical protein